MHQRKILNVLMDSIVQMVKLLSELVLVKRELRRETLCRKMTFRRNAWLTMESKLLLLLRAGSKSRNDDGKQIIAASKSRNDDGKQIIATFKRRGSKKKAAIPEIGNSQLRKRTIVNKGSRFAMEENGAKEGSNGPNKQKVRQCRPAVYKDHLPGGAPYPLQQLLSNEKKSPQDISLATRITEGMIRNSSKDLYPHISKINTELVWQGRGSKEFLQLLSVCRYTIKIDIS
ncbi:uncharacterized protein LOC104421092 isoform X1 [Eucalyptus grandis]|uniref:uncharacterized protein LOC104421092 isoform X1 n=1 Tax=Eucalyptus grandis TaxID=71139 RepID=UPI00192EDDA0|nr:uncharacterized protein LOC104421092 isoform X1 [Eucalyptus grandis]XP_039159835.1 uncharacterized protein LOC104421092 isoform X1 [Eucalyptus grandis]XP_039159836.1 uncharacterized protein LOC104421092 isoform X1 [Eucalyptus grandis]